MIADQPQRQEALDPTQSFIVQAPAGSGKTSLLTQRFLTLLAHTEKTPEEILAITFTRKAAAEMRQRIIEALQLATQPEPSDNYQKQNWILARKVLARDVEWNLTQNPNRLRIMTIDGLCSSLVRQMPVAAKFGSQLNIAEDASKYYHEAAQQLLIELDKNNDWQSELSTLLLHLDNDYRRVEGLLVAMLRHRDQWLPYLFSDHNREHLEQALSNIVSEQINHCLQHFPEILHDEFIALLNHSGVLLNKTKVLVLDNSLATWQFIAEILLTKQSQWRKSLTKNQGFPVDNKENKEIKQRMIAMLNALQANDEFYQALSSIPQLPPETYSDQQWNVINALITLLPILVAQLKLTFQQYNMVDFVEVASSAVNALGNEDNPTDLALILDHKIKHLLVDEFQDTSITQFRLLERLTMGWQPNDSRTLFLVGDPMQSIYRFRQAEVGLFLRAQQDGIGDIKLISITLQVNFRSTAELVDWFNTHFKQMFPKSNNIFNGSVTYSECCHPKGNTTGKGTYLHALDSEQDDEPKTIINIIKQNLSKSIAILVRSRSHLYDIIPALKAANIPFSAADIEPLSHRSEVQDLLSLTRALLHPADRLAWLSILRAPWCGLSLNDLHALVQYDIDKPIWSCLQSTKHLSLHGQARLERIMPILNTALAEARRHSLRRWIEGTWLALGGPACLHNETELENAAAFFDLLGEVDTGADIADFPEFENQLYRLFAIPNTNDDCNVHIMTMHKSKGLEFDVVILPGLQRSSGRDIDPLLRFMERPNKHQGNDLILAPIKAASEETDPIYQYLKYQNNVQSQNELIRLFYVAATRAKEQLHLVAEMPEKPRHGSFLKLLWFSFLDTFDNQPNGSDQLAFDTPEESVLQRLAITFSNPAQLNHQKTSINPKQQVIAPYQADFSSHIGTVVHEALQQIAETKTSLDHRSRLIELGVLPNKLDEAIEIIETAVNNTQNDERGRWILKAHTQAQCEYPLSVVIDSKVTHAVIDRTFIDEGGQRWIIDYKTGSADSEALQKYNNQLNLYGKALQALEGQAPKLGLYFPLTKEWVTYDYAD